MRGPPGWLLTFVIALPLMAIIILVVSLVFRERIIAHRASRRRWLQVAWIAYTVSLLGSLWLYRTVRSAGPEALGVPAGVLLIAFLAGTITLLALLPGATASGGAPGRELIPGLATPGVPGGVPGHAPAELREIAGSPDGAPARLPPTREPVDVAAAAVRVLFLASSPTDALTLKLSREFTEIDDSLRNAAADRVQLVYPGRVPAPELAEKLLRYDPTVLHFSGHGQPEGALVFEDEAGASNAAPPEAVADLFRILKGRLVCVVLSACYSRSQAEALRQYVDCVVGMTRAIRDDDAIRFSRAFYLALGHGKSIRTAFELGCNQIRLGGVIEAGGRRDILSRDAGQAPEPGGERTPVLLCREGVDPDRVRIV